MANIVVIGAGLGGLPAAYELHKLLGKDHKITVVSKAPKFIFTPSLPWVALGLSLLDKIQFDLAPVLEKQGITFISQAASYIAPVNQTVVTKDSQVLPYDHLVIATGPALNFAAVPGLGPEEGYTHSICTGPHALESAKAWEAFLQDPGPLIVGAAPGASCFGPAYEFAFLVDHELKKRKLRKKVDITFVTPEPYIGHMGIGGMANSRRLMEDAFSERGIKWLANAAIQEVTPTEIKMVGGQTLPYKYAMVMPSFLGPEVVRHSPDMGNAKGFVPVDKVWQHPQYPNIHPVGVITALAPVEETPIPVGTPKTGQMNESMALAVAHNIAVDLGVLKGKKVTPTLSAICFADMGDQGIAFLADPVIPPRNKSYAVKGRWVHWVKMAFEHYFLQKMRAGVALPFYEELSLKVLGMEMTEALPEEKTELQEVKP